MLLALATAQRVQTLTKIKISNIKKVETEIRIKITDQIKTSGPGKSQPLLLLPFFKKQPRLCVATLLYQYIELTAHIRAENQDILLLTHKKPHRAATTQSISRWIKSIMAKSGIEVDIFGSHSTRHAATSAAFRRGIDIDTIRKAAGWTAKSNVFARFYNRPVMDNTSVANAVINPVT